MVPCDIPYRKPSQVTAEFWLFATTFCMQLLSLSFVGDNHFFFQNSKHGVLIVDIVWIFIQTQKHWRLHSNSSAFMQDFDISQTTGAGVKHKQLSESQQSVVYGDK